MNDAFKETAGKEAPGKEAPGDLAAPDPVAMARRDLQKTLPRRFYKEAAAQPSEDGFALTLDGRTAKTPARHTLSLPTRAAADALAAEWAAQEEIIDPASMPLTRIANSAIDGVALEMEATMAEIARYGGSDLVCYRAGGPDRLAHAQAEAWDPLLDFARERLGARLICTEGVTFVEQPETALEALRRAIRETTGEGADAPFALAALHVMTTLTGSALIALAIAHDVLTLEEAWTAAHVDEDYQISLWGADAEATARRRRRFLDMEAATRLLQAVRARSV